MMNRRRSSFCSSFLALRVGLIDSPVYDVSRSAAI
jgi:hypothetical protein